MSEANSGPQATYTERTKPNRQFPSDWLSFVGVLALSTLATRWIGLALGNHAGLGTTGFDYGIYDQALWLLS